MIRTNISSLSRSSGLSVSASSETVRVKGSTTAPTESIRAENSRLGYAAAVRWKVPFLSRGILARSDSEILAETQTERRSASLKRTSPGSALWLGTAEPDLIMIVPSKGATIW